MNNATAGITDTTYSGTRERNTYMLIGFSFMSLLMIGIFLGFVHRKCRQSTTSAKQWCLSCCTRDPDTRCPSVSRTEEVTGTENNTAQVKPEPEHLYENLAFTDDDGKIKKEVVVKEKSVNLKREMQQCSGFCDTEDDSGISDVCTSPRCYESHSSIDTRCFAYDNRPGVHVYYNEGVEYDIVPKGIIRVLMPENLDTEYQNRRRKKPVHVYENIDKDKHTYVNVTQERNQSPVQSQYQQQNQQQQRYIQKHQQKQRLGRDVVTRENSFHKQRQKVGTVYPVYDMDPNYENLKPEKRLEHLHPETETVYYVNEHSTDRMLAALRDSFRHSQRKWQTNLLQENLTSHDNAIEGSRLERGSPYKIRQSRGFYRTPSGRRHTSSHKRYHSSPAEFTHRSPNQGSEQESRFVTQYVKAADGTLRAITLHV